MPISAPARIVSRSSAVCRSTFVGMHPTWRQVPPSFSRSTTAVLRPSWAPRMSSFVGLDWASQEHAVCVINERAQIVWHTTIPHTAVGLAELRTRLARLAPPATIPVAVERPSGLLIDSLVDGGFIVVPIHPNALKASRTRYAAAQGKSDAGDAFILADLLRTDGHRFRPLQPLSDETRALRALVRTRDDLVAQRVALANQLRALLESFWPGAAQIFADIDSPISLAFLHRYPTPHTAQRL